MHIQLRQLVMSWLIRIYTVCHSIIDFWLKPLFATMSLSKFRDGRIHVRNLGNKGLYMSHIYWPPWQIVLYKFLSLLNFAQQLEYPQPKCTLQLVQTGNLETLPETAATETLRWMSKTSVHKMAYANSADPDLITPSESDQDLHCLPFNYVF